jgi:predicted RNA polymerase sigma factor
VSDGAEVALATTFREQWPRLVAAALRIAGDLQMAEDAAPEEVDVPSGEMIGNFPQAFSHVGLINTAWPINQTQQRRLDRTDATAPGESRKMAPLTDRVAVVTGVSPGSGRT